jgi:hypothetical protein
MLRKPGFYWVRTEGFAHNVSVGLGDWELCVVHEDEPDKVWSFGWDIPMTLSSGNFQIVGPLTIEPPKDDATLHHYTCGCIIAENDGGIPEERHSHPCSKHGGHE